MSDSGRVSEETLEAKTTYLPNESRSVRMTCANVVPTGVSSEMNKTLLSFCICFNVVFPFKKFDKFLFIFCLVYLEF